MVLNPDFSAGHFPVKWPESSKKKTLLHMCFQTWAIEKKSFKKSILNISDIQRFSIIIGYT